MTPECPLRTVTTVCTLPFLPVPPMFFRIPRFCPIIPRFCPLIHQFCKIQATLSNRTTFRFKTHQIRFNMDSNCPTRCKRLAKLTTFLIKTIKYKWRTKPKVLCAVYPQVFCFYSFIKILTTLKITPIYMRCLGEKSMGAPISITSKNFGSKVVLIGPLYYKGPICTYKTPYRPYKHHF